MDATNNEPWAWREVKMIDKPREYTPSGLPYEDEREARYKCAAPRARPDWTNPSKTCECGSEAILTAYLDVNEWSFGWDCDGCLDAWDDDAIEWPFVDPIAWPEDLEALGFEVI
jgi:hypothetical protein